MWSIRLRSWRRLNRLNVLIEYVDGNTLILDEIVTFLSKAEKHRGS